MNRLWMLALIAVTLICLTGARVLAADGDDTGDTAADTTDTAAGTGDETTAGPDAVTAPDGTDPAPAGVPAEPSTRLGDQDLIH